MYKKLSASGVNGVGGRPDHPLLDPPLVMKFGTNVHVQHLRQVSLLTSERLRSTFKVIFLERPPATAMTKRRLNIAK